MDPLVARLLQGKQVVGAQVPLVVGAAVARQDRLGKPGSLGHGRRSVPS